MESKPERTSGTVAVPASTAAPLFAAVGLALVAAGLVTSAVVAATGALLFVAGAVGWFRELFPHEHETRIALEVAPSPVAPSTRAVRRLDAGSPPHRARLPVEIYPYSAGIKGGLAGGVAMAALAVLYGLLEHGSLWYTVNLLGAAVSVPLTNAPIEVLTAFHAEGLLLATAIHGVLSLLVGLLYGVLLPMVRGHPAFWGGVVAPLLWSALIASVMDILNPALNARIDWAWFVASQVAFGVVAGFVVARSERIATFQHAPLAQRAGLETQDE